MCPMTKPKSTSRLTAITTFFPMDDPEEGRRALHVVSRDGRRARHGPDAHQQGNAEECIDEAFTRSLYARAVEQARPGRGGQVGRSAAAFARAARVLSMMRAARAAEDSSVSSGPSGRPDGALSP